METPKKKIIRIKTKEEVLQQHKLAPMFNKASVVEEKPVDKPVDNPVVEEKPLSNHQAFLNTLDEKEMIAYHIAKSHLGLLFSLERSNCYLGWLNRAK